MKSIKQRLCEWNEGDVTALDLIFTILVWGLIACIGVVGLLFVGACTYEFILSPFGITIFTIPDEYAMRTIDFVNVTILGFFVSVIGYIVIEILDRVINYLNSVTVIKCPRKHKDDEEE